MKHYMVKTEIVVLALYLFWGGAVQAQPVQGEQEQTLSPYFLVISDDANMDQLPSRNCPPR